ncbi:hypothetical protein HWB80_gp078 [Streptomyces phage Karimac]|uniref:Uncharacterized protein n=1 Tax=Streptomyces phage Karimac TaxID=2283303 RepID=A0A345MHM8_9CAUD|nr:hypothetical protein HWB80_gp078 [Streptomyces phage Karimac]AXH70059.1 hypothetical protein SEA_KARIMAC_244 [Streptomyces phage Karimac]
MNLEVGTLVVLTNDPDAGSGWEGITCEVVEPDEFRNGYVWVKPLSDRPDGFKQSAFFWKRARMRLSETANPENVEESMPVGTRVMIVNSYEELHKNPYLEKWQGLTGKTTGKPFRGKVRIKLDGPRPDGISIDSNDFFWSLEGLMTD